MTTVKTLTDTVSDLGRTASEFGKETKGSVDELARTAARKLDEARMEAGDSLHSAASVVREKGRRSSEAIDSAANGAADRMDATATYIKDHDLKDAAMGLRRFSRKHMAGSLLAAGAVGFLVGSALVRATHSCAKAE